MAFDVADYRNRTTPAGGDFVTELFLRIGHSPAASERANLDRPDLVRAIASDFVRAGAVVVATYTDAANTVAMADSIAAGEIDARQVLAINRNGAAACRAAMTEAAEDGGLVFGAMGPVEHLLSLEEIGEDALLASYRDQAAALAEGGADAILCRTFTEIEALVVAVRAASVTGLPVAASMTFDCGPDCNETAMGVTIPQACEVLGEAGAAIIGCDRGEYPEGTAAVVSLLRESCDRPVWVELNAGRAEIHKDHVVYPTSPKEFGELLRPLVAAGACFIGGGWGATVAHIAELARVLRRRRPRRKRG